jgi:hypothetical protein
MLYQDEFLKQEEFLSFYGIRREDSNEYSIETPNSNEN